MIALQVAAGIVLAWLVIRFRHQVWEFAKLVAILATFAGIAVIAHAYGASWWQAVVFAILALIGAVESYEWIQRKLQARRARIGRELELARKLFGPDYMRDDSDEIDTQRGA